MSRTAFCAFSLILYALPLSAQNVWTAYVENLAYYQKGDTHPFADGVVSRFTPATDITVTRLQLEAAGGGQHCDSLPAEVVTNGISRVRIPIPNTQSDGNLPGPSSSDSGPVEIPFGQGTKLGMKILFGTPNCNPFQINVTVQYRVNGQ